MLAYYLDRTSQYAIKTWEDLASTEVIGAPLDVRRKCKLRGQKSFTWSLFELLASDVNYRDKKVRELIEALHVIHQEAKGLIEESPAYQECKENFLNKKISEFVDDFELIDNMATCLDQTSMYERTPFWRLLAAKLGVPKEKLDEIQHCEVNSTKALMECYYSRNPNITIEQFYEVVETQLKRDDILKILNPIAKKDSGKELRDVLRLESDEMTNICVLLNKPKSGKKNWESLADILGIPRITYQQFSPRTPESPTKILLEWIFNVKEEPLTVGQLISALRSIDRNDVVEELRKHFLQHSTTN
ncbi:PREDICTED: uncharacterized protein LOC107354412 isoform X2 [Acropora digitifera]|uniref:uncharacterized protein LOC107354412 isoform X2 n=1 Tax=Acropora digitifera TaxID=70779 RepID=UPI00077A431E|nr:PREDICTED: uncharacterized protein LOC107354412 isoform X2 [Acropora digitifera]